MKRKKTFSGFIILLFMVLAFLPVTARAASTEASGECGANGNNVTWKLTSDGTLVISGNGAMADYIWPVTKPWEDYLDQIKAIIIEEGVTHIGQAAFSRCSILAEIVIPATVDKIDNDLFSNQYALESVRFLGDAPSGLTGEMFIFGSDLTVYCKPEYYDSYKPLMDYIANTAKTSSIVHRVRICSGDMPATLSSKSIQLSAENPFVQLTALIGNVEVSSDIVWRSVDSEIAEVSKNGKVSLSEHHGSTLVYAEIPSGNGITLVTCQVRAMRNETLIACLPKSGMVADFPVTCNTSLISGDGLTVGYMPAKFVEENTDNVYYQEILQLTKSLTKNCSTDTDKAKAIHKWVSENIEYGGSIAIGDGVGQIYSVYANRASHCQGYSYLTGFMLYQAGISNAIVVGGAHMWNLALLDGEWVMIDSTWGEFGFDYNDSSHGYIDNISFGQGDCCFIIDDVGGVKLAGVGKHELYRDNITNIVIPDYVNTIFGYAFAYCENLISVDIPDSVTYIGKKVFSECSSLTSIKIPSSVTQIGDSVFSQTGLTDIYYSGSKEDWDKIEIGSENNKLFKATIHYLDDKYYFYENGEMVRSKEAYVNGAWRWFDADGLMAVDKDVYQPSSGGKWVRYNEDGEMVKGEDYRYGGWYFFESVTGAMMKGPVTLEDGRRVFYDTITGQMLKGKHEMNGQTYIFDEVDGHLISGQDTFFWVHFDGKDFWYENWQRQGWNPADGSYRGKEIYDPVSDAWYWLDSVQQGGKAVSKDVYQESYSAYPDREDGTGKWVRYDADGHMVKGWWHTDAGTYYFEKITGAMAKGNVTIDGVGYYFDVVTGIRQ